MRSLVIYLYACVYIIHMMFLPADSINKIKFIKELYLIDFKVSAYTLNIINIIETNPNELQVHITWEIFNIKLIFGIILLV